MSRRFAGQVVLITGASQGIGAQMAHHDLGEHVAEVGRDREVAALVARLGGQAWPAAVDAATFHRAAEIRTNVAQLLGAENQNHDQQHDQPVPDAE
jgi:NADP-dependent 3-hydroxy acid dehydrogenase YdfG